MRYSPCLIGLAIAGALAPALLAAQSEPSRVAVIADAPASCDFSFTGPIVLPVVGFCGVRLDTAALRAPAVGRNGTGVSALLTAGAGVGIAHYFTRGNTVNGDALGRVPPAPTLPPSPASVANPTGGLTSAGMYAQRILKDAIIKRQLDADHAAEEPVDERNQDGKGSRGGGGDPGQGGSDGSAGNGTASGGRGGSGGAGGSGGNGGNGGTTGAGGPGSAGSGAAGGSGASGNSGGNGGTGGSGGTGTDSSAIGNQGTVTGPGETGSDPNDDGGDGSSRGGEDYDGTPGTDLPDDGGLPTQTVPEPETIILLGTGIVGLTVLRRKRKQL